MKWLVIGIISTALLHISCRETTDGCCDDSYATNFDPEAEERSCCEYPLFIMGMDHYFSDDSSNVIPDTALFTLPNSPNDSFQIASSAWFIYGMQVYIDENWIDLEGKTTVVEADGTESQVIQNFDVHERSRFRLAELGELRRSERPDSIRFSTGWTAIRLDTTEMGLSGNSALQNAKELKLYSSEKYVLQCRLELRQISGQDTNIVELPVDGNTQLTYAIDPVVWERGFERRIQLKLSYDELLANYSSQNNVENNIKHLKSNINNETIELDTIY